MKSGIGKRILTSFLIAGLFVPLLTNVRRTVTKTGSGICMIFRGGRQVTFCISYCYENDIPIRAKLSCTDADDGRIFWRTKPEITIRRRFAAGGDSWSG